MQTIGLVRVSVLVHGRAESPEKGEKKSQPVFSQRPVRGLSDVHCTVLLGSPAFHPGRPFLTFFVLISQSLRCPVSGVRVRQGQLWRLRWGPRGVGGGLLLRCQLTAAGRGFQNSSRAHSWGGTDHEHHPIVCPSQRRRLQPPHTLHHCQCRQVFKDITDGTTGLCMCLLKE